MNPIKENIAKILDLEKLSETEREEILMKIGSIIFQNVLMRALETITENEQNEFDAILDKNGSPEEIFQFLSKKISNFDKIVEEEALKFKNKSIDIMGQIG